MFIVITIRLLLQEKKQISRASTQYFRIAILNWHFRGVINVVSSVIKYWGLNRRGAKKYHGA